MTNTATPTLWELRDRFLALEEELGLFDRTVNGGHYWPVIRYEILSDVCLALGLQGKRQGDWRNRSFKSWMDLRPGSWGSTARRSLWHDAAPADVLVFNHPRHLRMGDHWACPYSEPLLNGLPYSRCVVEDVFQGKHSYPTVTPGRDEALKYLEWPRALAYVRESVLHPRRALLLDRRERRWVRDLALALEARLGAGPSPDALLSKVRMVALEQGAYRHLYERLLDRVRPRAVVQVVHYSHRNFPMTVLARERGIPVIELQHGVIGPLHLAYNYTPGRRPAAFPDYLLTFGDWWRTSTTGLPLSAEEAPAVGYAWLDQHLRHAADGANGAAGTSAGDDAGPGGRRRVLFLSQGTIGVEFSRLAVEAVGALDPKRYLVRFKLHPGETAGWRQRYPWLAAAADASRIEVVDTPTNVYDEFRGADVQVGVYSTALFEGVAFGLQTIIAELPGHEALAGLVEAGAATTFATTAQLTDRLETAADPDREIVTSLWADEPRARAQRFFEGLLG